MDKGTSEIAKLTERISKDPKSKLFVPLAEEYKKAGDIEMAIAVLTEGLKNNPGYVTAKSFLGRLLLDKGNLSEAQKEFEEVIKAIPDNVLAQRKLGDVHALQGRAQEALQFFKAVLAVNPKDPELKSLIADIEAGRDVREKIAGPKYKPAAAPAAAAVPMPRPPLPPVKPSATPAVLPMPQTAPAGIPKSVDAEEPEEVLVFELLDKAAPAGALLQPEATQDMFAELVSETGNEEAARMDDGLAGGQDRRPGETALSKKLQPFSGSDADMMPSLDVPASGVTEHELGSTDIGQGNSFFDSEQTPIDIPADDSGVFDTAAASEPVAPVTEHELGSGSAGLPDSSFFDSGLSEPQKIADALEFANEPAPEVPAGELMETGSPDDSPSETLFFDVEPVETEEEPQASITLKPGEELAPFTLDVPAPGQDSSAPENASSDSVLFDAEPAEEALLTAQVSDRDSDVSAYDAAAPFGETLPEADDFTTDTLAELYIAQGFYEKAIEIYERMLADRPNSKLLKDKLANVRAMGSASSADEEQGTPVFFEAPGSPTVPSPPSISEGRARQWNAPGAEAEAKEYIAPSSDDFESTAFDSGFAPVEYVLPHAPGTVTQSAAARELPVQDEEPPPASSKTDALVKEQTIVRLDNWLKNIMKEK